MMGHEVSENAKKLITKWMRAHPENHVQNKSNNFCSYHHKYYYGKSFTGQSNFFYCQGYETALWTNCIINTNVDVVISIKGQSDRQYYARSMKEQIKSLENQQKTILLKILNMLGSYTIPDFEIEGNEMFQFNEIFWIKNKNNANNELCNAVLHNFLLIIYLNKPD